MVTAKAMEMVVAHPDPVALRALQLLNLAMAIKLANAERRGEGIRYSKFATSGPLKGHTVASKRGMAILYTPAAVACSTFLLSKLSFPSPPMSLPILSFFAPTDHRLLVFAAALTAHFVKRLLEVFFVHKYSGSMEMSVSLTIAISYFLSVLNLLYAQQLSMHLHPPVIDLIGLGVCVFLVGITGNFYHHYLLATLRSNKKQGNSKGAYVTPQGGLFTWVVCPHYLFECISFFGLALIGQTSTAFVNALCTFIMLGARSQSTKLWYQKKIENFPTERKAFIPFLF